jgi:hypothetical protein
LLSNHHGDQIEFVVAANREVDQMERPARTVSVIVT